MTDIASRPAMIGAGWRARAGWRNPLWLALPGIVFLVLFLAYPALQLLSLSVIDPQGGGLSLAAFRRLLTTPVYLRVLTTTFVVAAQTTALCLLFGYPLAYWLARQPARRQQGLMLLVLLPFWTSPLVLNFAWLVLLGRNGAVAGALMALGIDHPPDLLFGRGTVLFALTHSMLPLAVVTMLPTMSQIDERLPRAAATLGASGGQRFWRVWFHLSMPGVAAAGLLVFVNSVGFFITPAILGGPQETMLSQLIINQIQKLQNWPFGAALAAMLIAAALLTCIVYDYAFGLSSVSGGADAKTGRRRGWPRRLGMRALAGLAAATDAVDRAVGGHRLGWLLPTYAIGLVVLSLLPIVAFIPMGFTSSNFLSFPPPGFSTRWFEAYLESPVWIAATIRSFGIGLVTAAVTLLIAAMGAFGIARTESRWAGLGFVLFLMPMVVPPIVIAIALFYLFAGVGLVATDLGIVIGHTVTAIPIAFVVILATLKGHDWRYDQAAATLGASRSKVLARVTIPLIRKGLFAAFIFAFLQSFQELTIAMFIGGGLKTTLPKQMWDDVNLQVNPTLAAASVVVMVVVTGLFLVAGRLRMGSSRSA
ncbi:ABC transporter permease subunit [Labrys wisconsinensis]|uniref:Spermidine/putrescine transport system permease protein n=1 Tax=Labrys wisconsinensis TaxID=425677 RepID=A0ABU0J1F0_9HYPH|nr:ABC transporter permease subunit [Labrys wisconsinensis]MDQ0468080.1 putative spermidine/putrescine transport system permease protein [Labrys wisconsinensis]